MPVLIIVLVATMIVRNNINNSNILTAAAPELRKNRTKFSTGSISNVDCRSTVLCYVDLP